MSDGSVEWLWSQLKYQVERNNSLVMENMLLKIKTRDKQEKESD